MTKIVYNGCYGGFSLSADAVRLAREISGNPKWGDADEKYGYISGIDRDDDTLVRVVETLGDEANGSYAKLCIEEIPAGTLYRIDEYDGYESVETNDSIEWSVAK